MREKLKKRNKTKKLDETTEKKRYMRSLGKKWRGGKEVGRKRGE